jgi:hypothetical protein
MVGWRPTFEGPLNALVPEAVMLLALAGGTLAPEAQILLARRAAAAAGEAADGKRSAIVK